MKSSGHFSLGCLLLGLTTAACGPSIDSAAKADVDARLAAISPTGQAYPPASGFLPMPLKVGQWTTHKMTDDKNLPSLFTYKIVGEEGGAFWVETVSETYYGKSVTKMLVAFGDRKSVDQIDIRRLKTKDKDGRVTDLDAGMLTFMRGLYKDSLKSLVLTWQGQPQEDATAPAGTFPACYKVRVDVQFGPFKAASTSWGHTSVPISGTVKSQGIDKPFTMELVSFGETGATSEIP